MWYICFSLDLFTANGTAGSEQTEVGLGVSNSTWFHWALLGQAEDLPAHQAHPEKACSDFCCSLCHRWGTKTILCHILPLLSCSTSVNYKNTEKDHNWYFKFACTQHVHFPTMWLLHKKKPQIKKSIKFSLFFFFFLLKILFEGAFWSKYHQSFPMMLYFCARE